MQILFFKMLKQKVEASSVILVCFFMIALLTCGCAGEYKKETALEIPKPPSPAEVSASRANETGQVSEKGEIGDDQKIECRRIVPLGSRISKKICGTKEQWAEWDGKTGENAKGFMRDATEASRMNTSDPWAPVAP